MRGTITLLALFVGMVAGYGISELILREETFNDLSNPMEFSGAPSFPRAAIKKESPNSITQSAGRTESRLTQILAQLSTEELEVKGTIVGRVTQQSGAALAGAKLSISVSETSPDFGNIQTRPDSLVEFVEQRARRYRFQHASQQQVLSASDGSFEFLNLPDTQYQLEVKLAGYRFEVRSVDPEYPGIVPGARLLIVGSPVCRLTVDVRLPDGSQAKSAELTGVNGLTAAWSQKEPIVNVKPGSYMLRARVGAEYVSELQAVSISNREKNIAILFQLNSVSKFSIDVTSQQIEERYSCYVVWQAASPGRTPEASELLEQGHVNDLYYYSGSLSKTVLTPSLARGRYWVGVGFVPWRIEQLQNVELQLGVESLTFNIDHIPEDLCFQVQVTGSSGEALDVVRLGIEDLNGTHIGCQQISRGNGRYLLLPDIDPEAILEGANGRSFYLLVDVPELGKKRIPLDSRTFQVSYAPSAELQVEVLGLVEKGSYRLTLQPMSGDPITGQWQEEGYFLIKAEVGSYHVKLLKSWRVIVDEEVVLSPGMRRIQLSMPAVFSLLVDYSGDELHLGLFSPFGEGSFDIEKEVKNEQVEFSELLPGKYFISSKQELMAVNVVGNTHVRFVPMLVNALGVVILFPKNHETEIHESGLQNGDLIIGLGSRLFDSLEDMQTRFADSISQDRVEFIIERDGVSVKLVIDSEHLKKSSRPDGNFRLFPTTR